MTGTTSQNKLLSIYMDAAEVIQHGVMWLDKDGNILGVNSQFAYELGYEKDDFARKTIFQVNPSTTLLQWRKLWQQLIDNQEITLETQHITAQGTIYPVKLRGVLIQAEGEDICYGIVENILDRQRYHRLLQMTEEISRTGSWEWNPETGEVLLSEGALRLLNVNAREQLTHPEITALLQQRLPTKEFEIFNASLENAVKKGASIETELNFLEENDARAMRVNLHLKPIHIEGRTHKVLGILQDLTGMSGRTEELYLTQFCIDNAYEMISWLAEDARFTYVNHTISELLGYSKEELLQMSLSDLEPEFSIESWQKQWQQLKKEKKLEIERQQHTKDGQILTFQIFQNYVNFNGKEYCLQFARDLTKKKKRDEIIQLSYYTLSQAREMIYWLRADSSFRYFNDAFCSQTGFTRTEIQEMQVLDFYPEVGLEEYQENWNFIRTGKTLEGEYKIARKDGTTMPVEGTFSMIEFAGEELILAIFRDITYRKNKEQELQQQLAENEALRRQLEEENVLLKEEIKLEHIFSNIISKSKKYKPILQQVEQVADTNATVLIMGETGTGKELLAKAIHQLSNRANRPIIKINCGALPESLIESELFGHEKGAFTGAYQRKIGRFEAANHGTLFLDEVAELPLDLQVKLLRVLQEQEFERVGGSETILVDVRLIAATNQNLEARVKEGRFRQDLYYRLNVFPIFNLPLRERLDDVPLLVRYFVEKFNKQLGKSVEEIPQNLLDELLHYDFPGNVRELENIVERGMIISTGKTLNLDLSFKKTSIAQSNTFKTMEEMQRDHILEALRRAQGKVSGNRGAAHLLDLNPKTLTSRMKKLGIERMDYLVI